MKVKQFTNGFDFLSNFYPAHVALDGVRYDTVEHAYQAAKTLDKNQRQQIRCTKTPGEAKKFGRKLKIRDDWENIKIQIMEDLVRQKFTRHPDLSQKLLETGDADLEEGNRWNDKWWGVDIKTGEGRNELGKILMRIRKELSDEM